MTDIAPKINIAELIRRYEIHKKLIEFAHEAFERRQPRGVSKFLRKIDNKIELILILNWLESNAAIYRNNTLSEIKEGDYRGGFKYSPPDGFEFNLEKSWFNPYFYVENFNIKSPNLFEKNEKHFMNILSPQWIVNPDEIKDLLLHKIHSQPNSDTEINNIYAKAITAYWKACKHEAAINTPTETARILISLRAKVGKDSVRKIDSRIGDMIDHATRPKSHKAISPAKPFTEKIKPKNMIDCYICHGVGKTLIGRMCSRCQGKGFTMKETR